MSLHKKEFRHEAVMVSKIARFNVVGHMLDRWAPLQMGCEKEYPTIQTGVSRIN